MPDKLHFYTHLTKEKIKLSNKAFASGGEGALYPIASPRNYGHLVAKIYYPEKRTAEREAKMKYLIQNPPVEFDPKQHLSIVWVLDLIYLEGKFVGVIMKRVEGKKLTKLTLAKLPRKADEAWHRFAFGQEDTLKLRLRTCFNIAVVIHLIHRVERYVLVDLKPDNVLMQPNGLISIVDMDSVEVVENGVAIFPAPVATPEYTPPEFYTTDRTVIEESWDRFSLAVIFYQLLFGLHPFAASANAPYDNLVGLHDKIKAGLYVHHPHKDSVFKIIPPPHQEFYKVPVEIQTLFQQCFDAGHEIPEARPSAEDWCAVLAVLLNLPFERMPNLGFPPSDLYFLPSESARRRALVDKLPAKPQKSPSYTPIATHKIEMPTTIPPKVWVTEDIKNHYKKYLTEYRTFATDNFLPVLLFSLTLIGISPWILTLNIFVFIFLFFKIYSKDHNEVINKITSDALGSSDKYVIKNRIALYDDKMHEQSTYINNSLDNIKVYREKIDLSKLSFIENYFKNRASYQTKLNELFTWEKEAEIELKAARTKELDTYKKIGLEFQKSHSKNPSWGSINNFLLLKKQLSSKTEEFQKRLASLSQKEELLEKKLQHDLLAAKELFAQNCQKHQEQVALVLKEKIKKFTATELKTPSPEELDYKKYLAESNSIKFEFNNKKIKAKSALQTFLRTTRHQLGLKSEKSLEKLLDIINDIPEDFEYHAAKKLIEEKVQQQIDQLNLISEQQPSTTTSINLIIDKLSTLLNCAANESYSYLKDHHKVQKSHSQMVYNQKNLFEDFDVLIKLVKNPKWSPSIDLAYWINDIDKKAQLVQKKLISLLDNQEQFFQHSIIAEIRKKTDHYQALEPTIKKELDAIELEEVTALEELAITYANAIAYNSDQNIALEHLELKVKKYTLALEKEKDAEWVLQQKTLEDALEQSIKDLKEEYDKNLDVHQQWAKEEFQNIKTEEKYVQQEIDKINVEYQKFEQKLVPIREEAEVCYSSYERIFELKIQELEELLSIIQKDQPLAEKYLAENEEINKKIILQENNYNKNLAKYEEFKEERIKIDSLIQWKENYSRFALVKDMLTNKNQLD